MVPEGRIVQPDIQGVGFLQNRFFMGEGVKAVLAVVLSHSAVLSTMQGLLPPSSRVMGVRWTAADSMTRWPTAGLPVKKI